MLLACLIAMPVAVLGCEFKFDPAASVRYYRAEGWELPGIRDFDVKAPISGELPMFSVPGVRAAILPHRDDPYIINFPAQVFTVDGERKRMRPILVIATLLRLEVNGKVFGYCYGLIPVEAHRVKGEWKIESEAACVFSATFVDETGNGIFVAMYPGELTAAMVPAWVRPAAN
jgi:hypothetical protein